VYKRQVLAFKVTAWDGALASATPVGVSIAVAEALPPSDSPWVRAVDVTVTGIVASNVVEVRVAGVPSMPDAAGRYTSTISLPPGARHGQVLIQGFDRAGVIVVERHVGIDLDDRPAQLTVDQ
jgi:hypothetical protein